MNVNGPVAAVIGSPVAHSLSPVIHRAAFVASGLNWNYVAFDVAAGASADAVHAMRTLGLVGLSVTMPHKQGVAAAVDRLDPAAAALGAVNTVSWEGDDLVGSSTDGDGFVASLGAAGVEVGGVTVGVLGAGGAAASVVDALGRAGAESIVVFNRTAERAVTVAGLAEQAEAAASDDMDRLAGCDIVVNATSVGMGIDPAGAAPADLPCDVAVLAAGAVVADLVYHPLETAWMRAAEARGLRTVDGLGMLVHQAALQQLRWTGALPDTEAMRSAAEAELARR